MRGVSIAQPDVTLLLDMSGVIREATLSNAISSESTEGWLGSRWLDTIKDYGGDKVQRMVDDTRANGISAFRQMTQCFPSGLELPMEYTTVLLGGRAGMLAIGKSLKAVAELQARLIAAQQTMERDYWRIRDVETRYRLLFEASNEAVMLVRVANLRVVEANPAAVRAMGFDAQKTEVVGREFMSAVIQEDRDPLLAMLQLANDRGKAPGIMVHLGEAAAPWLLRASLMISDSGPAFLLQLTPALNSRPEADSVQYGSIEDLVAQLPDGFVVIDTAGIVRRANRAFLDLVEVGSAGSVIGQRLNRWLSRPGADATVLLAHVLRHGTVKLFNTSIHGELGTDAEVEISAVSHGEPSGQCVGILIRDIERRLSAAPGNDHFASMLASLTSQIGKTPMRKLVKDTVIGVERHYVKAALELANGKRTAAAELLGLSRQSLYAKLNRYGLEQASAASAEISESSDGSE